MSSPGGEARPMAAEPGAGLASPQGGATGAEPARVVGMCLLLGAAGVGKSLLVKRLQTILPAGRGPRGGGGAWGWARFGGHPGWATRDSPGAVGVGSRSGSGSPWGLEREPGGRGRPGRSPPPLPAAPLPAVVLDRLAQLSSQDGKGDLGDPPSTRPTVGTNLTDIVAHRKITIRELGGCMGPIWSSYYGDCRALLFMVDASNPTQLSASCAQLLGLLSAEPLADAPVLILFNKTDLSCYMTVEEMKSLIRLPDIIACATQTITVADVSARTGTGLAAVLQWLQDTHGAGR
uniref:ADP ribosylation factor like GTPase 16 n=2 Tax=Pipistrellus kuhlii TaxID=59472 RepID=A0A7J7SDX6_PIPKU|nr:ADP ribosylation factor like GTPase 16 [Pipistrellus kuhlii]